MCLPGPFEHTGRVSQSLRAGIDLGGTKIEGVVLDGERRAVVRRRVPTPRGDYEKTLEAIHLLVRALEEEAGSRLRIGVGIPGTLSPATGLVKNANSTWLIGRPLGEDLGRVLQREVKLANDADCFALSEATDGAAAGDPVVFGVILGTGVGGGLVVSGRLVSGPNAITGEWGHNPLPAPADAERPGPPCYCGRRGCIETFLSGPAISRDHAEAEGEEMPPEQIASRAAAGDAGCRRTLDRHAERLSRALAGIINVIDPHVIVLGGGLSRLDTPYQAVPALWGAHVFSDRVDTRLAPPKHGDASGARGAAWLWEAV